MSKRKIVAFAFYCVFSTQAHGQVPVIDGANLGVARENASNTRSIMQSNAEIQKLSQQILGAVSGQRTADAQIAGLLQAGLGGGNSIAAAPSWGELLQGNANFASFNFGGLTNGSEVAKKLIDGLNLASSVSKLIPGGSADLDRAYRGAVSTVAMLTALTSQAGAGVTARQQTFSNAAGQIGGSRDVKGSIDQNTQIQAQTGQRITEFDGVTNGAVPALNAEQIRRLQQQQAVMRMFGYDGASPVISK